MIIRCVWLVCVCVAVVVVGVDVSLLLLLLLCLLISWTCCSCLLLRCCLFFFFFFLFCSFIIVISLCSGRWCTASPGARRLPSCLFSPCSLGSSCFFSISPFPRFVNYNYLQRVMFARVCVSALRTQQYGVLSCLKAKSSYEAGVWIYILKFVLLFIDFWHTMCR